MVTGDNRITAEAIAIECGIIPTKIHKSPSYDPEKHVWNGKDFWN